MSDGSASATTCAGSRSAARRTWSSTCARGCTARAGGRSTSWGRSSSPAFPSPEAAWRVMQGTGYGRVDLRVDEQGQPWVLDVNPNPDLNDAAGLSRMAQTAGWDYAELVRRIAEVALREAQGAKAARELLAPSRRTRAPRTA